MKTIYLGAGCFWCTEAIFASLAGVVSVTPGYMGGDVPNPSYEAVCSGTTGHAEVAEIVYDEQTITTDELLDIFFDLHDPTTLNRQGADVGTQYRSVIFYTHDQEPLSMTDEHGSVHDGAILSSIARKARTLPPTQSIVTQVLPATMFYPAEEYHREYYLTHTTAPYCQLVISPKLEKLQRHFPDKMTS